MDINNIIYIVFGVVLVIALVLDLGILNKKHQETSIQQAFYQTLMWIGISLAFWLFLWYEKDSTVATKYISAYLMEWSLSLDNIFVFIIIFNFFKVDKLESGRALLVGVLLAIILRILFIALGLELIDRVHWILYAFGVFLIYTGVKLFMQKDEENYNPNESPIYKFISKRLNLTNEPSGGKYILKINGKVFFTNLSVVVIMLAITDVVFAVDSIPTVVSLVRQSASEAFTINDKIVIYSSNIFAVLGLRSLFFVLKGASNKFHYLQQGIALILLFIGIKMLIEYFDVHIPIIASLLVIVFCLVGSIVFSVYKTYKGKIEAE